MTKRSDERALFLADVVITAVEGGIGYWARTRNYRWDEGDDAAGQAYATVEVFDADGALADWKLVNADTVAHGIGKIRDANFKINPDLRALILGADAENDAGNIDADAADVIVQAGLFGEIVYG